MQFLRTLIWVLLAGILVAFSFNNWVTVPIRLWGGLIADINLPLLLGLAFAIGFVPLFLYHAATGWRLRARLASAERALADLRGIQHPVEPAIPILPADAATAAPSTINADPDPVVEPTTPADPARTS